MSVPAITILSAKALVMAMPSKRAEQCSDAPALESPAGLFTTYARYRNVDSDFSYGSDGQHKGAYKVM
jgi:hypothetical protein